MKTALMHGGRVEGQVTMFLTYRTLIQRPRNQTKLRLSTSWARKWSSISITLWEIVERTEAQKLSKGTLLLPVKTPASHADWHQNRGHASIVVSTSQNSFSSMQISVQAVSYEFLCKGQFWVCMFELEWIKIIQLVRKEAISDLSLLSSITRRKFW